MLDIGCLLRGYVRWKEGPILLSEGRSDGKPEASPNRLGCGLSEFA